MVPAQARNGGQPRAWGSSRRCSLLPGSASLVVADEYCRAGGGLAHIGESHGEAWEIS
jgi:hypothetical protein